MEFGFERVLTVIVHVHFLPSLAGEKLHKLKGGRFVLGGVACKRHAADIHVGSPIRLIWENHINRVGPDGLLGISQHKRHVVVINNRDVTLALTDGLYLSAVIALGLTRKILLNPDQPLPSRV